MSIVGGEQVRAATRLAAPECSTLSLHEIIDKTQTAKTPVSVLERAETRGVCGVMAAGSSQGTRETSGLSTNERAESTSSDVGDS
jgi:hypothetical protein